MSLSYDFDQNGHIVSGSALLKLTEPKPDAPKLRVVPPVAPAPTDATRAAVRLAPAPLLGPLVPQPKPADLRLDRSRDALLTDFGKKTLTDRYLLPGESYQDMFARVATAYADDVGARPAHLRLHLASCGSCRRRRCCRTAAPTAACRSPAS